MPSKKVVHYFTNIAPHYRQRLWELMAEDEDMEVEFHFGKPSENGIKEIDFEGDIWLKCKNRLHRLKNVRLFNRIVWQRGVINKAITANIRKAILLGDMNILSTWIAGLLLRVKGAEVYFWGHGFIGGESFLKKYFRIFFYTIAHEHFIYGHRAKNLMINYGFEPENIHVVYNSLDYDKHKYLREEVLGDHSAMKFFKNPELPTLVFIGRLTEVKKLGLLIKAVSKLNSGDYEFNLLIIGDGEEKENLMKMASSQLINGRFHFYGACYDEKKIGEMLANTDLCVSPGNVGLTAIHSLSFGTPVCTHNNFTHQMPECEVIETGVTGFFFEEDDVDDLSKQITIWFKESKPREEIRKKCYQIIDKKYNPYNQLNIFKKVLFKI